MRYRQIGCLLSLSISMILFQNCGFVVAPSGNDHVLAAGGGTDGMLYQSYGPCANNQISVSSAVVLHNNSQNALMTTQNCQTLSRPVAIDVNRFTMATNDSTIFALNGQVFDQQSNSGTQKMTLEFCQSNSVPSVQASVWQISGHSGGLFGNITFSDGSSSGPLNVQNPSPGNPNNYVTVTGQASQFNLMLGAGTAASLTYSRSGGTPVAVSMTCSTQSMPAAPASNPAPPSGAITNGSQLTLSMVGPAAIGITSFTTVAGTELSDGQSYPFAQQISSGATYDGFTVNGPHLLIQGYAFSSSLDIYTSQTVVIRGSQFRFPASTWNVGIRPGAGKVYVLFSDLGAASAAAQSNIGITDMQGGAVFYRNHVSMAWTGLRSSDGGQVIENYIDQFVSSPGNGIVLDTDSNVQVLRNKVLLNSPGTCALCIYDDYGPGSFITVDSNYLAGGGYTVYGGANSAGAVSSTDIVFTNNVLGLDFGPLTATYGPLNAWASTPGSGNVWRNNSYSDGTPLTSYPSGGGTIPSN
jgi:hypothetical protein